MLWRGRDRKGRLLPFFTFVFGVCDCKTVGEVDDPDTSFADSWSSSPTLDWAGGSVMLESSTRRAL